MTSRARFDRHLRLIGENGLVLNNQDETAAFGVWQAAERDMLERCIELIQSQPDGSYRAELITAGLIRQLKDLLNEQH